jgi:hypothetical protein
LTTCARSALKRVHDRYTQKTVSDSFDESEWVASGQVGFFVSFDKTAVSVSRTRFSSIFGIDFDSPRLHSVSTCLETTYGFIHPKVGR